MGSETEIVLDCLICWSAWQVAEFQKFGLSGVSIFSTFGRFGCFLVLPFTPPGGGELGIFLVYLLPIALI